MPLSHLWWVGDSLQLGKLFQISIEVMFLILLHSMSVSNIFMKKKKDKIRIYILRGGGWVFI